MSQKSKREDRSKLEAKMCLAQDDPEPVFDLSSCNLHKIPKGVFIKCKVLRKKQLLLHDNHLVKFKDGGNLSDLNEIELLDLHTNLFQKLPDEINVLSNLKILNLAQNKISKLPSTFGNLYSLECLYLQENSLKSLPESFYNLCNLHLLNLSHNKLTKIGPGICKLTVLQTLNVAGNDIADPPKDVVQNGLTSIFNYFGGEISETQKTPVMKCSHSCSFSPLDPHISNYLHTKEEKLKQFQEIERDISSQNRLEAEINTSEHIQKEKLFSYLKEENILLGEKLKLFKQEQDEKKRKLQESLLQAEEEISKLISRLTQVHTEGTKSDNQEGFHTSVMHKFKRLLSIKSRKSSKEKPQHSVDIYSDMYKLLAEESQRRHQEQLNLLQSENEAYELLRQLHDNRAQAEQEAISHIQKSDSLQREAVTLLYVRADKRRRELIKGQLEIGEELLRLTEIEMQFRKEQSDLKLGIVQEQRKVLASLLDSLRRQQTEREHSIRRILNEAAETEFDQVPWVEHFTFLTDCHRLESLPHPQAIAHILSEEGFNAVADIFLQQYPDMTIQEFLISGNDLLMKLGIDSEESRVIVLKKLSLLDPTPTAPMPCLDPLLPSAPPESEILIEASHLSRDQECIVCFANQRSVVFVPCGHLCSCTTCASSLGSCPVCRVLISSRVEVINV